MDYFIPEARLIFEVNSKLHFYPGTQKKDNLTKFKSCIYREFGQGKNPKLPETLRNYNHVNVNSHLLHNLVKDPENLDSYIYKIMEAAFKHEKTGSTERFSFNWLFSSQDNFDV